MTQRIYLDSDILTNADSAREFYDLMKELEPEPELDISFGELLQFIGSKNKNVLAAILANQDYIRDPGELLDWLYMECCAFHHYPEGFYKQVENFVKSHQINKK